MVGSVWRAAVIAILGAAAMGLLLGLAFEIGDDHGILAALAVLATVVAMFATGFALNRTGASWLLALAAVWAGLGIAGLIVSESALTIWLAPGVVIGAIAFWRQHRRALWQRNGRRATAEVLEAKRMPMVIDNYVLVWRVRLRVDPPGGSPAFEGTKWTRIPLPDRIDVGDRVPVLVDPARPGRFTLA